MAHASWKARLLSRTSSTHARHFGRGRGASSTTSLVRVRALSACGKTKNSKWRWPSTRASRPSRTSASGAGASTPRSVKAGTVCSVTSVTTPSAPTATRAASRSSPPSTSSTAPAAVTSRSARTCAETLGSVAPVPCVAVAIAPAIDCSSMSPRFGIARPCSASAWLRACSADAGLDADEPAGRVGVEQRAHAVEAQQRAVGERGACERVPRARHAHAAARRGRALDGAHHLPHRGGPLDHGRLAALIAGPVGPHARTLACGG